VPPTETGSSAKEAVDARLHRVLELRLARLADTRTFSIALSPCGSSFGRKRLRPAGDHLEAANSASSGFGSADDPP
jgi:hypothetical protein